MESFVDNHDESSAVSSRRAPPSFSPRRIKSPLGVQTRSVANELLRYIQQSGGLETTALRACDKTLFEVPQVLLCARCATFELMIKKQGLYLEGVTKTLQLPEDADLVDAFICALKYDKITWLELLVKELTSPGSVPDAIGSSSNKYFLPIVDGWNTDMKVEETLKQRLLGRVLDLLSMAHKYQFESLVEALEDGMLAFPPGVWDAPMLVLGILRMSLLVQSLRLEAKCMESLQELRGADLLAWLNPKPLEFWARTRSQRVTITGPKRELICCLKVALCDTVFYLKEVLSSDYQSAILALQEIYEVLTPSHFLLQHKGLTLDSRRTLAECQVKSDDELKIRFIKRRHTKQVAQAPCSSLSSNELRS